ncbi:hypothetical protein HMPREF9087_3247 [Enterococcus casseliflavus ATCC 12755]|uniref:Serine dehydrogenase proteinase n=1 Tax=Enterococcus casseliflavus ATCC 12755 TaxID=888066 RepID=F0EPA5_ENTCA|nr:ATP-dependent Clp protease proteolytic subunit [Enterococcus casseliflavus]EGC68130.1 hypothetical protein HMPREF9087_3247 [Enterococcus casseliflavus ATCC 12755]
MGSWQHLLNELLTTSDPNTNMPDFDGVRRKYINMLEEYTGRNVISYYSAFNEREQGNNLSIKDGDMEGFMNAVHGMDRRKGLDLILHTPGGNPSAAESIVKYLRFLFKNDIRVIVPHMAMSAGTMIACASKEIIMGYQSSLGPIDPQFQGIPAYNIQSEFEEAKEDLQTNPSSAQYWAIKLQQYPAAFMKSAIDAIELSNVLVKEWLQSNMFLGEDTEKVESIVRFLNEHTNSKTHDRHFDIDTCKNIGLKIVQMEDDNDLQDRILSVHHATIILLQNGDVDKIIESASKSFVSRSL